MLPGKKTKTKYTIIDPIRYVNNGGETGDKLPVLFTNRENCCGCGICCVICPVGAISMQPDKEGFPYPVIDVGKCVGCKKCVSACAFIADQEKRNVQSR